MYWCEKCSISLSRKDSYENHLLTKKHLMSKDEYKAFKSNKGKQAVVNGEQNELFVLNIIKSFRLKDVVYKGNTSNKFDIFIQFEDESHYRGLQVKTLIEYPTNHIIKKGHSEYESDTLVIAVNNDKNKFVLIFSRDMTTTNTIISSTHNSDKLITKISIFRSLLLDLCRKSTIVKDFDTYLYKSHKQEVESIDRFKIKCKELSITFKENNTNSDEVDAIVNGHNIQFKSSKHKPDRSHMYHFGMFRRSDGNDSSTMRSYNDDDKVDIFIFEIADDFHQGHFYIIPKKILIEGHYIETDDQCGKLGICISERTEFTQKQNHWSLQFLDKFNILTDKLSQDLQVTYGNLHKKCKELNLICKFNSKNKIIAVSNKCVKHLKSRRLVSSSYSFTLLMRKDNAARSICIDDGFKYIIFEICGESSSDFYVIPIEPLVKEGYISDGNNPCKQRISLRMPEKSGNKWIIYFNNFTPFNVTD